MLQETKVTNGIYTRRTGGYSVTASEATSAWSGGIALCWRQGEGFEVEETRFWRANVLAFELVTGARRYYVVGMYLPPGDLTALEHARQAVEAKPKGTAPLILGDLNANLESPRSERDEEVAAFCDSLGVECMAN